MKNLILFLMFLPMFMHAQSRVDGYIRIFNDDYNGKYLSSDEYHYMSSIRSTDISCRLFDTAYERLENGVLKLKMIYSPGSICEIKSDFKSQEIWTFRRYKYGRYSIRAKINYAYNLVAAFWMFGGTINIQNYPYSEIDMFEAYLTEKELESNVHIYDSPIHSDNHRSGRWHFHPSEWHTYTFDWTPEDLKMYTDGKLNKELYNSKLLGNMNIILGLGSFNWLKGFKPNEMPVTFDIDFLTVDYPIDTTQIVRIDSFQSNYGNNTAFTGKKILVCDSPGSVVFKGNPSKYSTFNMDLVATESIRFKPGFHAEENSNFRAWIVDTASFRHNLDKAVRENDSLRVDKYMFIPAGAR